MKLHLTDLQEVGFIILDEDNFFMNKTEISTNPEIIKFEHKEFTQSLVRGENSAWSTFFDLYHGRLKGYITTCWHGEVHIVDDILQDTLLRAVKYIRVSDDEDFLWSWLTVLARSAVADQGRRRNRFIAFVDRFRKFTEHDEPCSNNLDGRLTLALTKLTADERDLIELKYEHGKTVRDIASMLNTTEKSIESRLSRCRVRLNKHLINLK